MPLASSERYVETRNSFLDEYLTGTLTGPTVLNEPSFHMNTVDTPMNRTHVHYSPTKVKRAIHLVRHPFNNIVARFHLEFNNHKSVDDFTTQFPSNRSGFRAWCQDLDQRYHRKESKTDLISSEIHLKSSHISTVCLAIPSSFGMHSGITWHYRSPKS